MADDITSQKEPHDDFDTVTAEEAAHGEFNPIEDTPKHLKASKEPMSNKDKWVIGGLVLAVMVLAIVFVVVAFPDILPKPTVTVEMGDCVDMSYIGKFSDNGTVFDSSYADWMNKTGDVPLNVFVSTNPNVTSWKSGYINVIEGLAEGIVGMKTGETKTVGPIPPAKAYGTDEYVAVGDQFITAGLVMPLNITAEFTAVSDESLSLKWMDVGSLGSFTMPQFVINDLMSQTDFAIECPPSYLWKNATVVTNFTDDNVTVRATPTSQTEIINETTQIHFENSTTFVFPDASEAEWDEEWITVTSAPVEGANYSIVESYSGTTLTLTVESINATNINVSVLYNGEKQYAEVNTSVRFPRSFVMPRDYVVPSMYASYLLGADLATAGLSLNPMSGKALTFEVTIDAIYTQPSSTE